MAEQFPTIWTLIAQGENLKQEGLALAQKYPEHAASIKALLARGEMMRSLLAEAMVRESHKETKHDGRADKQPDQH